LAGEPTKRRVGYFPSPTAMRLVFPVVQPRQGWCVCRVGNWSVQGMCAGSGMPAHAEPTTATAGGRRVHRGGGPSVGDGKSRTTAAQQAPPQQRWRGTACTCRAWLWHHHCHGGAPFYCQQTGRQHRKRRGEGEGRGEGGSQRSAECVLSGTVRPVCTCISASPWRASVGVVPLDSP